MNHTSFLPVILLAALAMAVIAVPSTVLATAAKIKPDGDVITGIVTETMNTSGYTYLRISSQGKDTWVAIPETEVKKGEQISCMPGMEMKNFQSKTLGRTFESIIFSEGIVGAKPASPHRRSSSIAERPAENSFAAAVKAEQEQGQKQQELPNPSGGSMGAMAPYADVSVERAAGENSYTVGELFARAEELNGTTVKVRGKVVKYNANIMGRHWLHIQDGTGEPMNNTHDLVVTTRSEIKTPGVLTVEGVLAANKDFGAGYKYSVIIEEASVVEQ